MRKAMSEAFLARAGAAAAVAGAVLVLMPAASVAQAKSATTASAPSCGTQPNKSNPTDSHTKVLDSYWFAVNHGGKTTAVCTLSGNVKPGDIVTAHITMTTPAPSGQEVTLASYLAPAPTPHKQTLFACASHGTAPDPASASDTCVATSSTSLTVTVPNCGFQVDLIYGEPIASLTQGTYVQQKRFIDGDEGKNATCTKPTPPPGGGASATPTPSGVQALTTPGTGVDLIGLGPLGALLVLSGAGAVAYGVRRRGADVP